MKNPIRRVFRKKRDTFDIDGLGVYRCPSFISGRSIEAARQYQLTKNYSETNIKWEEHIQDVSSEYKNQELGCIKEFPLPIKNKMLLRDIARRVTSEVCKEQKEKDTILNNVWNNSYYILDYFYYNLGLAVELDSHWHVDKRVEDMIRDMYVEEDYGIRTIRTDGYGVRNSKEDTNRDLKFNLKFRKVVRDICKQKKRWGLDISTPLEIDFQEYLNEQNRPIEEGYSWVAEVARGIYDKYLVLPMEIVEVDESWIEENWPGFLDDERNIEKLKEFFYEQYFRKVDFRKG